VSFVVQNFKIYTFYAAPARGGFGIYSATSGSIHGLLGSKLKNLSTLMQLMLPQGK
jgi:hypothetical protein